MKNPNENEVPEIPGAARQSYHPPELIELGPIESFVQHGLGTGPDGAQAVDCRISV
jgi:hypothetical protein